MEREVLNRYLNKLNESIRNIKYQINSINSDIQKNKKQSYIEKRIDRLIENYKVLDQKYKEVASVNSEPIKMIKDQLIEIKNKVETICRVGSKEVNKQNIKLDEKPKQKRNYIGRDDNKVVLDIYGEDGQLELVYMVEKTKSVTDRIKEKFILKKENKRNKKNGILKRVFSYSKRIFDSVSKGKIAKRIVAIGMGILMLAPGTITANQNEDEVKNENTKHSYADAMEEMPISNNELLKVAKELEETKPSAESKVISEAKIENQTEAESKMELNSEKKNDPSKVENERKENELTNKEKEEIHIIAPAQCKYTEVSDGRGNYGVFNQDTEVAIYNRALIRTNKDGSKSILRATKIGQTWKQYAEEQGINYDEFKTYIQNNKNIQEVISTISVDGKIIYGWIPASNLEYRTESKQMKAERNYVIEIENR